jgi:type II secretory pathway pseudopilin PulG
VSRNSLACARKGAAFTVLEILVTLALIGLLSAFVVGGVTSLLRDKPVTGEEVLRVAISRSRRYAVENLREVRLSYLAKDKTFKASSLDGLRSFPVEFKGELAIDFLPQQKENSILLGGQAQEIGSLPFVTFYPDGGCSPFRAQIRTGGPVRTIAIDPWTCAPMLEEKEK